MANSSTTATTARPGIHPSPPTCRGPSSSARSDAHGLIAQAQRVVALKQELIARERLLRDACYALGVDLAEVLDHASR
jgi:hypothetical protein